jgi:hypothetical protein
MNEFLSWISNLQSTMANGRRGIKRLADRRTDIKKEPL